MAGSVAPFPTTTSTHARAVIDQWQVQYARFVVYNTTVEHPSLVHIPKKTLRARGGGAWIPAATSASLEIVYQPSAARPNDAVLVLSVRDCALEKHYISSTHFSWPQVSCVVGFPPRGTKAVFVSYKDGFGQIQKFALRFSNIVEAAKFMDVLKELLTNATPPPQFQGREFSSALSFKVEPTDEPVYSYRPVEDWHSTEPVHYGSQLMLPFSEHHTTQGFTSQETEAAKPLATLPPSFTQLLKNCQPEVEVKPTQYGGDIKTQFANYLRGTSFSELLSMVENAMNEADDFLL